METIDAPAYPTNGTNIITMYAVWVPAEKSDPSNPNSTPVYLQDFTNNDCNALTKADFNSSTGVITPGSVIALTDKRDDEVYTIAKLADNNCWMVENLRLEHEGTVGNNKNDSTITNQSLSQSYGGTTGTYGNFVGLANPESANFSKSSTTANSIYKSSAASPTDTYDGSGRLEDIGTSNNPAYRFPRYNSNNTQSLIDSTTYTQNYANASSPSTSGTFPGANLYSYGNYYTWAAAMANTNYYNSSSTSEAAGTSICPFNWHLPSSNSTTKEYGTLSTSYGGTGDKQSGTAQSGDIMSNRFRSFPNNFLYPGYFNGSSANRRGSDGYYWSRSANSVSSSYYLGLGSTYLGPSNDGGYKHFGFSVRCLINTSMTEIILDYNDNTGIASRIYDAPGNSFDLIHPYKNGYKVKNWNTAADGTGAEYITSYTIPSSPSKITLYAQWTPTYTIQYDGNGADNPNGMGTTDSSTGIKSVKQINVGEGDSVNLLASNFKRAGYSFAGWSTSPNATVTSGDKIYGPMETIEAPAYPNNGTNTITMYAVWVAAEKDGNNNPIYLQDFTSSDCNALTSANFNSTTGAITPGSVIALTDKRDNQIYTVAKLADNDCWMVENLRLEQAGTVGNNINDSSVTNQSLSQGYGGTTGTYGNFVGLASSESTNFSYVTTSNTIYKSDGSGDAFNSANGTLEDIGTSGYPEYRFPRYNSDNTQSPVDSTTYTQNYANSSSPSDSGTFPAASLYSYGNYYTWAAAMANTNHYSNSSISEAVNTSICPSGWHLPSSNGATKEYGALSQSYGGTGDVQDGSTNAGSIINNRLRSFPNNFLHSGGFDGSSAYYRGYTGSYWSRSARHSYYSYFMLMSSTSLSPAYSDTKSRGFTIRCLIGS